MDCQPRTGGGTEGKSSDDIVYEIADSVQKALLKRIYNEDPFVGLYKVKIKK